MRSIWWFWIKFSRYSSQSGYCVQWCTERSLWTMKATHLKDFHTINIPMFICNRAFVNRSIKVGSFYIAQQRIYTYVYVCSAANVTDVNWNFALLCNENNWEKSAKDWQHHWMLVLAIPFEVDHYALSFIWMTCKERDTFWWQFVSCFNQNEMQSRNILCIARSKFWYFIIKSAFKRLHASFLFPLLFSKRHFLCA